MLAALPPSDRLSAPPPPHSAALESRIRAALLDAPTAPIATVPPGCLDGADLDHDEATLVASVRASCGFPADADDLWRPTAAAALRRAGVLSDGPLMLSGGRQGRLRVAIDGRLVVGRTGAPHLGPVVLVRTLATDAFRDVVREDRAVERDFRAAQVALALSTATPSDEPPVEDVRVVYVDRGSLAVHVVRVVRVGAVRDRLLAMADRVLGAAGAR